jgi:hypothetical protein
MTERLLICCHATGIGTTIATVRSIASRSDPDAIGHKRFAFPRRRS